MPPPPPIPALPPRRMPPLFFKQVLAGATTLLDAQANGTTEKGGEANEDYNPPETHQQVP